MSAKSSRSTRLLDHWQAPQGSGDPLAAFACTYAIEAEFLERHLLSQFLRVTAINEGMDAVADDLADIEMTEALAKTRITVLSDRSMRTERSSLSWDHLQCSVTRGLFHPKTTILIWENATRVLLGSANLTQAGYRKQIEIGLCIDLGPECLLPKTVLNSYIDELELYLDELLPSALRDAPPVHRARDTLQLFRGRVAALAPNRSSIAVALAPTNRSARPMETFRAVWKGTQPTAARHLSPFWDADDTGVWNDVHALLRGQGTRRHDVVTVLTPRGTIPLPQRLSEHALRLVETADDECRLLHAKTLLVESPNWIAALVGSSNHTQKGFGLRADRHREMNLWLGCPPSSAEGKALKALLQDKGRFDEGIEFGDPDDLDDEESTEAPGLPLGFAACVLEGDERNGWRLHLTFDAAELPMTWTVTSRNKDLLIDIEQWTALGRPTTHPVDVTADQLETFVIVTWPGCEDGVSWPVVASDPSRLPPTLGPDVLSTSLLLEARRSGRSVAQAMREKRGGRGRSGANELDPHVKHQSVARLLRNGRHLSRSIDRLQETLSAKALTIDQLKGRFAGLAGPRFLFRRFVDEVRGGVTPVDEALFAMAEIVLGIGRAPWAAAASDRVPLSDVRAVVMDNLTELELTIAELNGGAAEMHAYAADAVEEAKRCLVD